MTARTRSWLWLAAVAVLLAGLGVAGIVARRMIHPDAIRARLIAEVQHRTGRALALDNLKLAFLPDLRVDADNVALANPAGFSRPAMLTAAHLTARIALLPLLHRQVIVTDLTLHGAELDLERPADGPPNWVFATGRPSATLPHAEPAIALPRLRLDRLTLLGLTFDGSLVWQAPNGAARLPIERLTLREVNDSSTITLALTGAVGGDRVQLAGQFGGQSHLWHTADTSPWPISLRLTSPEGAIGLAGSLTQPDTLSGYDLTLTADGPDIGKLFTAWPDLAIPRLADLHLATRLIDRPDGLDIPRLALTAGVSDLSPAIAGLSLDRLAIAAPNIDGGNGNQRNRIDAAGSYAGQQLSVMAAVGPVGRLFGRGAAAARGPIALDAALAIAGAALTLHGFVAPVGDWSGTDIALDARIPDLSLLSPLAGRPLPRWQGLALHGMAVARHGTLSLNDVALTGPVATLTANGTARLDGRPRIQGTIHATTLDLDAIRAAWRAARVTHAPVHTAIPGRTGADWIVPNAPLPRLVPSGFDADIGIGVDTARLGGIDLRAIAAHAVLTAGHLSVDPVAADIGTAHLAGRFAADAVPASYALQFTAPGLDAGTLLALAGLPQAVHGRLDLDADLTASGASLHDLAGTLNGVAGIALTDGSVDTALLSAAVDRIGPAARFGSALPRHGQTAVACLATRLAVRQGVAVPAVFLLDTKRFRLAAAGAVYLGQERVALRLRPVIVLGGSGLIVPIRADGPWQSPRLTPEPAHDAPGAGSFAADASLALADTGDCGQAVAAARASFLAAPSPPPLPPQAVKPVRRSPLDLLKQLLARIPKARR